MVSQGSFTLPAKDGLQLPLNKGINTISISGAPTVSGLTINNSMNQNYRGASLPYIAYQAEECYTTGTVLDENRAYREISSEAAGRLAVNLDGTGRYIKITLLKPELWLSGIVSQTARTEQDLMKLLTFILMAKSIKH